MLLMALFVRLMKLKALLSMFYRCRNGGSERSLSGKVVQL